MVVRYDGTTVAVVGLGAIANPPLIEFLVERGASVTACDRKSAAELGDVYTRLAQLPIRFALGEGYLSHLEQYDTVYLTPAVRRDILEIQQAKAAGVEFSSEILLFMHLCAAHKVAITGSSGKTTTTTLTGEIFREAGKNTYVAGNIGVSLIKEAESIPEDAWVVLELSSFQLQDFDIGPQIAAVTNVTPNHLDYHSTMDEYADAKRRVYLNQAKDDVVVMNWDDKVTRSMARGAKGRVLFFSRRETLQEGAFLQDGKVIVVLGEERHEICAVADIRLPGLHNLENVLTASAIAVAAGLPAEAIRRVVTTFTGVEHRLEFVRTLGGVDYYNDSIATTPDRTMAGVRAFERPVILIAGGYDKHLPFDGLAEVLPGRVKALVLLGATAPLIRQAVALVNAKAEVPIPIADCDELEAAVRKARDLAEPGDIVLLSPACASYDMYRNFQERGNSFRNMVASL